jgi:hypothetical protein
MKRTRVELSLAFNTRVTLEELKEIKERETIQQIASRFEVHASQFGLWK